MRKRVKKWLHLLPGAEAEAADRLAAMVSLKAREKSEKKISCG
jgi:hypothetical protein